jgi:GNAT superfamily N-acetyltransferase
VGPGIVPAPDDLVAMDRNAAGMLTTAMHAVEGGWVGQEGGIVVCGAPFGIATTNVAMVLGATTVGEITAVTRREFVAREVPYSVWTRDHADADLSAALEAAGWSRALAAPAMICRPDDLVRPTTPRELRLTWVRTERDRAAYQDVMEAAWGIYGIDRSAVRPFFARLEALAGSDVLSALGWVGAEAVAGAILYCLHGVAGIGWVGTLPSASRRGYGAAVTAHVVEAGLARGMRFASLQASPLGEPVYRRMGFRTVSHYHVHLPRA